MTEKYYKNVSWIVASEGQQSPLQNNKEYIQKETSVMGNYGEILIYVI